MMFTFNTFALENGKFECVETHENIDGRTEIDKSNLELTDLYLKSFDEKGSLDKIYAIGIGWVHDSVNNNNGYDEDSYSYKIERSENKLVMEGSEAPYDVNLQRPVSIDNYYRFKTEMIEAEDGSIIIITRDVNPNYPEFTGTSLSACTRQ